MGEIKYKMYSEHVGVGCQWYIYAEPMRLVNPGLATIEIQMQHAITTWHVADDSMHVYTRSEGCPDWMAGAVRALRRRSPC